jgi:hypothetical protein
MATRSSLTCCIILLILPSLLPAQTAGSVPTRKKPDWTNTVADVAPDPADAGALAVRKNRNSAFDDQTGSRPPLDAPGDGHGYSSFVDYVRLPPLPVADSQVVLVGRVAAFQPFLSNDRTAVYTELQVNIERMFKDSESVVSGNSSVTIPQRGGALRLPGGKVVKQFVALDEKVLDVGARYLLFLNYDSKHDWFAIVKAWELRNGRAKAQAQTDVRDAIQGVSKYDEMDESQFLQEVQNAVNGTQSH